MSDSSQGNILIDNCGNARICDFGLVRIVLEEHASDDGMITTSDHAGTDRYLAFELMVDGALPTAASDIYALGCLGLEVGSSTGCELHDCVI
jgi:serine/threonine protein kinase